MIIYLEIISLPNMDIQTIEILRNKIKTLPQSRRRRRYLRQLNRIETLSNRIQAVNRRFEEQCIVGYVFNLEGDRIPVYGCC